MSDVVVIGGANMDLRARSTEQFALHTSNPGTISFSPGGVGRNVAENIARLGTSVALVSVVGDDQLGEDLIGWTAEAGVDCSQVRRRPVRTGTYNALLDAGGELVAAVADMAAADELTPLLVEAAREVLAQARLLVLDGNLAPGTVSHAVDLAASLGLDVVIDPVSVAKAARMAEVLGPGRPVRMVTPNRAELAALTGLPTRTREELHAALERLHDGGVEVVWARLGPEGSVLRDEHGLTWLASPHTSIVDVTGAGDAMMGAFCHALVGGAEPREAARYGQAAAALTVASAQTVRPDLSDRLIRRML